jgi:hypothetical protein
MSTFATVTADLYEGDYMASCDILAAFHHVRLHPESYKYVGFALDLGDGRGIRFFHFCILVFGLKSAGQTLTRVLKPIIVWLGQDGIRLKFYIDDGIVSARGKAKADKDYARVLDTLKAAGFMIAMNKSHAIGTASCRIEYLGLIIDSKAMTISVPPAKMAEVRAGVRNILDKTQVTIRELSSVVGKVFALEPATGPSVMVETRMASNLVAETSRKYGWGLKVFCTLDDKVKSAMREVHRRLPEWDSHPVRSDQTSLTLAAILPGDSMAHLERKIPNFRLQRERWAIASDASETKVASFGLAGVPEFEFVAELTFDERQGSSSHRELTAIERTLAAKPDLAGRAPKTLFWFTDNQNVARFLTKGSGKPDIMDQVLRILALARGYKLDIKPIWIPRDEAALQKADALSKDIESDEWSVSRLDFVELEARHGKFSVDLFATDRNTRCLRFFSKRFDEFSDGTDAFAFPWTGEHAYAEPPISLMVRVVRRMAATRVTGVLMVPLWKGAQFWTHCLQDGRHLNPLFHSVQVVQIATKGWFRGGKKDRLSNTSVRFMVFTVQSSVDAVAGLESLVSADRCIRRVFGKECYCD